MAKALTAEEVDGAIARSRTRRAFERRAVWLPGAVAAAAFASLIMIGLPEALLGAAAAGGAGLAGVGAWHGGRDRK